MRVTPPDALKIDREELLRDVRERLEASAPAFASSFDPANPAWIVLQEAAWMVERLSERLDQWPWASLQQFAHLVGARLRPAVPALGVVVVDPAEPGVLDLAPNPARWRLFASRTEERGLVEFAFAETGVPVHVAALVGLARLRDGELWSIDRDAERAAASTGDTPQEAIAAWLGDERRADVFADEIVRFHVRAADPDRVEAEIREAVQRLLETRDPGWLALDVTRPEPHELVLEARIDVSLARVPAAAQDVEDVVAVWRPLDDSAWTPPVRVADHALLPPSIRGMRPMRADDGQLLVPNVPRNMLREELLVRDARPAPAELPDALWRTLVHLDRRLAGLQPGVTRGVRTEETDLPWVDDVLRGQAWHAVERRPDRTFAAVALPESDTTRRLRVGWVVAPGADPRPDALARFPQNGVLPVPLTVQPVWEVGLPDPAGRGLLQVVAVDVEVPAGADGVLLAADGRASGVLLNVALVLDAPLVRDGRDVVVSRAVPEPVSLLHEDVVTPDTLDRLASSGLPASAQAVVRAIPSGLIVVDGQDELADFAGVDVEPNEGVVTLHAPDTRGRTRALRRGQRLELRWYRRTSGGAGNVPAGAIDFVEQAQGTRPRLVGVTNPLPTSWGQDRERPEEATLRVFGPQAGLPVTPADWERLLRIELGARAERWIVRVWGYAERTLLSHALWPAHGPMPADAERARFERELAVAGPEALVVVVGPTDAVLGEIELAEARRIVEAAVGRWSDRVPAIRRAVVTRLWPLRAEGAWSRPTPMFSPKDVDAVLVDPLGGRGPAPVVAVLLNAAIVGGTR